MEFRYLEECELPALILGIPILEWERRGKFSKYSAMNYKFKPGRVWELIIHQTAGVACHHHYIMGTRLTPRASFVPWINELADSYLESQTGVWGTALSELNDYEQRLQTVGLSCNLSYTSFEEGIYPIDAERVGVISEDVLPVQLDDLIDWDAIDPLHKFMGAVGRWKLWILGTNSD